MRETEKLEDMSVLAIMQAWPPTVGVFLDFGLHCVGCPIGPFHSLGDASLEHGVDHQQLVEAITASIRQSKQAR
jgi:hybrid cluster-associated redox disulfide protein